MTIEKRRKHQGNNEARASHSRIHEPSEGLLKHFQRGGREREIAREFYEMLDFEKKSKLIE